MYIYIYVAKRHHHNTAKSRRNMMIYVVYPSKPRRCLATPNRKL